MRYIHETGVEYPPEGVFSAINYLDLFLWHTSGGYETKHAIAQIEVIAELLATRW